jgi:hypothetical protein
VVLRRPLREGVAEEKKSKKKAAKQLTLDLPEATYRGVLYEYAVLVTSLQDEVRTIAQHYRDRGDSENNFDEFEESVGMGRLHHARPETLPGWRASRH